MTTATLTFDVHANVTDDEARTSHDFICSLAMPTDASRSMIFAYGCGYRLGRCAGLNHDEAITAIEACSMRGAGAPKVHQREGVRMVARELEAAGAESLAVMFGYRVLRHAGVCDAVALMNLRLAAEWGLLD